MACINQIDLFPVAHPLNQSQHVVFAPCRPLPPSLSATMPPCLLEGGEWVEGMAHDSVTITLILAPTVGKQSKPLIEMLLEMSRLRLELLMNDL